MRFPTLALVYVSRAHPAPGERKVYNVVNAQGQVVEGGFFSLGAAQDSAYQWTHDTGVTHRVVKARR